MLPSRVGAGTCAVGGAALPEGAAFASDDDAVVGAGLSALHAARARQSGAMMREVRRMSWGSGRGRAVASKTPEDGRRVPSFHVYTNPERRMGVRSITRRAGSFP